MAKSNKTDDIYECLIDYSVVNANIKKYREKKNITQEKLAEKSHITAKYLSRLENNHYKGRLHIYVQIAAALNMSVYDLIEDESQKDNAFAKQIIMIAKDMSDNQKEMLLENIELIKRYKF